MYLFQIGLPTLYGVTAVTTSAFASLMDVGVATITINGQSNILIVDVTFTAIDFSVFSEKGVIGLSLMIEIDDR